jgi:hypothetical protein
VCVFRAPGSEFDSFDLNSDNNFSIERTLEQQQAMETVISEYRKKFCSSLGIIAA